MNAGSSSLKCSLMDSKELEVLARATVDWAGDTVRYERVGPDDERRSERAPFRGRADAVRRLLHDLGLAEDGSGKEGKQPPAAVGHRVVHGGEFRASVRVTPAVRARILALADLAPLHNVPGLEALAATEAVFPDVPHVAVFDTAFHSTLPAEAYTYPLPKEWSGAWGIRRYGFHGMSHSYCARRAADMLGRDLAELNVIVCHLGHGCSATAVRHGESIDTTMGFTPLDGLMMGTRSGSLDPGILIHVQQKHGVTARDLESTLNRRAGLLGVSGVSGDMREVLSAAAAGHEGARLALGVYTHRVRQAIGGLVVTMGGVDALVFTAGVGENVPEVRDRICRGLECLGLHLDLEANASCRPDADVARYGAGPRILVIRSREDVAMLGEVVRVVERRGNGS